MLPIIDRRNFNRFLLAGSVFGVLNTNPLITHASDDDTKTPKRLLFFTKSSGFEHSVIQRTDGSELSYADRIMMDWCKELNVEVVCSKDGRLFDKDYLDFDAYFFFTTGDLCQAGTDNHPPMSVEGKANLLQAITDGKGFLGSHCATDTFHSPGSIREPSTEIDPYIQMIGGEFIGHGRQQQSKLRVTSPDFVGMPKANDFMAYDEWYSLKNFAPDMHVLLVQETEGMLDADYERPSYPSTWVREHGKGRVFYTSNGHREDMWTNEVFKNMVFGALEWTLRRVDMEVPGNLEEVAPECEKLPTFK